MSNLKPVPGIHPACPPPRRLPLLARIERRGMIDGALALLAFIEWRGFATPMNHLLNPLEPFTRALIHSGSIYWFVAAALLTWLLLALGALAHLMRRPSARPHELPSGAGLWIGAYGLMFLIWLVMLFNTYPEALWGFWHLARAGAWETALMAILVPLALAPVWRRLARKVRQALLRRRRNARALQSFGNPAQTTCRRGWAMLERFWPVPLLALYAVLFADHAIMSDGWGIIGFAHSHAILQPKEFREAGIFLLFQQASHFFKYFGLYPSQTISLINFFATLGTLALMGWLTRIFGLPRKQRRLGGWIIFSSLGVTQMLLGHIEAYPLAGLSLTATVVLGAAALWAGRSIAWMAIAFALGLAGHLSVIFVCPAVLLALWFWTHPLSASSSLGAVTKPRPTLARALGHLFGWGCLIHLPLWGMLMLHLGERTPMGLIHAILTSLNTGAAGETFIGSTQPTLLAQLGQIVHPLNLFKVIQILFYVAGGPLLVAILIPLARFRKNHSAAANHPDPAWRRQMAFLGLAWLGYAAYALTWHNDWTWLEDWDLFSGIAPLSALLVIRWLMPGRGMIRLPSGLVRQVCLFALALSVTQHYFYHTRFSYVNGAGKISLDPVNGRLIQRYQFDHGLKRGDYYTIENGKVVLHNFGSEPDTPEAQIPAPTKARP